MKRIIYAGLAFAIMLGAVGCNDFDRNTFNTLSVSNAELKQAQADYESGKLPHTSCVYNLITKGKAAQGVAVVAFEDYYVIEQNKGDVAASEAAVVADLAQVAPIVASIKALSTNPNCGV